MTLGYGLLGATDFTIFSVGQIRKQQSDYRGGFLIAEWNTGAQPGTNEYIHGNGSGATLNNKPRIIIESGTTSYSAQSSTAKLAEDIILSSRHDGSTIKMFVNGEEKASTAAVVTKNQVAARVMMLATMNANPTGNASAINIAEVIVYSKALTTTERETVEEYLSAKYDITLA
jgi:hypothetical protein